MDIFQNLLNKVRQGYGQVDKNIFKGVLPGGASISSSVAPMVRSVSQSPIYKTIRDKAVIPVLDAGMKQGLVPSDVGMFGRYLSGTDKPLTIVPKDIKKAEAIRSQTMRDPQNYSSSSLLAYQPDTERVKKEDALTNSLGQYVKKDGIVIDRYDFGGYTHPGNFNAGVMGEAGKNTNTEVYANMAGRYADKFGFITPKSGYDIQFNLSKQSQIDPTIQEWRTVSNQLKTKLQGDSYDITPELIELSKKERSLDSQIKAKGLRVPDI
jgi:hypothetical protein